MTKSKEQEKIDKKEQAKVSAFFNTFAEADEEINFRFSNQQTFEGGKLPVISTGSLVLNDALSSGGYPKGRVIQLYGAAGSGKTLLAMIAIKEAQKADPAAMQCFIDAEQTFDKTWAAKLGINLNKVFVVDGDNAVNGRRCFTMLLGEPKEDAKTHEYKGKKQEGLLDKISSKELNFNMIVLDSLGQIIPPGEDVSKVGKFNMSLMARFLSKEIKRLVLEVKKANIPFIIINHQKDNMDPYGSDHTFSGGNSYNHSLSANVYFRGSNSKDKVIFDENDNKVGNVVLATVEKSKFGPWPRKCEIKVDFRKGIVDIEEEIYELAVKYNIINKTSSVTHEYGDNKWTGRNKTVAAIKENESLAQELTDKIDQARIDAREKLLEQIENQVNVEKEVVESEE